MCRPRCRFFCCGGNGDDSLNVVTAVSQSGESVAQVRREIENSRTVINNNNNIGINDTTGIFSANYREMLFAQIDSVDDAVEPALPKDDSSSPVSSSTSTGTVTSAPLLSTTTSSSDLKSEIMMNYDVDGMAQFTTTTTTIMTTTTRKSVTDGPEVPESEQVRGRT